MDQPPEQKYDTNEVKYFVQVALGTEDADTFIGAITGIYCQATGVPLNTFNLDRSEKPVQDLETLKQIKTNLQSLISRDNLIYIRESMRILQVEDEVQVMLALIELYLGYE